MITNNPCGPPCSVRVNPDAETIQYISDTVQEEQPVVTKNLCQLPCRVQLCSDAEMIQDMSHTVEEVLNLLDETEKMDSNIENGMVAINHSRGVFFFFLVVQKLVCMPLNFNVSFKGSWD